MKLVWSVCRAQLLLSSLLLLLFSLESSHSVDVIFPSCTEEKTIVDLHNMWRKKAGAMDMLKISYNHTLALESKLWTELCSFQHSNLDSTVFKRVGQNLYATDKASFTWEEVISSWGNEVADFTFGKYDEGGTYCRKDKVCGHYTQLVWAKSYLVGCSFAKCPSLSYKNVTMTNGWAIACDYFVAGNVPGDVPFKSSPSCPSGYSLIDGLCSGNSTDNTTCQNAGGGIPAVPSSNSCMTYCINAYFLASCVMIELLINKFVSH